MKEIPRIVAQIGLDSDEHWTVYYHGTLLDRDGFIRKPSTITFYKLEHAMEFLEKELKAQAPRYLELLQYKA